MKPPIVVLAGLALVAVPSEVRATSIVLVDYSFEITETFGGFPAPVAVSGTAFYSLGGADLSPLPDQGIYSLLGHSVLFGGVPQVPSVDARGVFASQIGFEDQVPFMPPRDRIVLFSTFNFMTGDIRVDGIGFVLEGPASVFTGDDAFIPRVTDFTIEASGFVGFENLATGGLFSTQAPVSVTFSAIPSPPAVVQLAFGLVALRVMAWRRQRREGRSGTRRTLRPA
jgi:hypothetical protein